MEISKIGFKMSYNPDIPQANDDPSQSQGQILSNFQTLNTFLSQNHVPLNDGDQGKHAFLQMPEQSSDPATAANEAALYCKEYDVDGLGTLVSTLFFRNESNGAVTTFGGPSSLAIPGYAYLPGGLLVQWNRVAASSGSNVPYPIAFGAPAFYVNFAPTGTSGTNRIFTRLSGNPSATTFSPIILNTSGGGLTETIYYIAIGPAA